MKYNTYLIDDDLCAYNDNGQIHNDAKNVIRVIDKAAYDKAIEALDEIMNECQNEICEYNIAKETLKQLGEL